MIHQEFEDAFRSHAHAEKTTDDPLIRVMALHALAYCERLFYLEEVEEIRVADHNVYEGRRMHEGIDKGPDVYSMELASERLGIRGKVDVARREDGKLTVVEHKKGKSQKGTDPWPSDRLQILAYALLLAEHAGEPVPEVALRYHADRKTLRLAIDPVEAEKEVIAAVRRARVLRSSLQRPPVTASERLCRTCSLAPVCLPEEERFAESGEEKAERLFPQDDTRRIVHVVEQGASIGKDGEELLVWRPDGSKKAIPGLTVSAVVLHGNVQISTQAVHFCVANQITVHWLSYGGHYVGAVSPGAGGVQRRARQFRAFEDKTLKATLCLRIAEAKIENQVRYLLRATRTAGEERDSDVVAGIERLRHSLAALAEMKTEIANAAADGTATDPNWITEITDRIRGYEGVGSREYFGLLPRVVDVREGDLLFFSGRNRRPPRDPFNALLSFGYALLYRDCVGALLAVGLEPALGVMHTARSSAYPLALDLMELFRLILWDVTLVGSVNRKQWTRDDFEITKGHVWLNADGRRKAIGLYEARKQEKWKHPVLDYSLSYARTIELEARLLEKEWAGQPSLFAKMRIR